MLNFGTGTTNMRKSGNILVVDDHPANVGLLKRVLINEGYIVRTAEDGASTFAAVEDSLPDLILLDIMMPDMNGFEVCQRLKADAETSNIPIIFISARSDTDDTVKGLSLGAVDYITKPFQTAEVKARVATHITLHLQQKRIAELTLERERARLLSEFIRDTSHDLRTPLSRISTTAYLIDRVSENPQVVERITFILQDVTVINNMITQMSRLISIDEQAVSTRAVHITEVIITPPDLAKLARQKSIDIATNIISETYIDADAALVGEAFHAVLENAILYTKENGSITVLASQVEDMALISITDTGIGIDDFHHERIFDQFYKVNTARTGNGSGAGLGLPLARKIVTIFGGRIVIESQAGLGSTFHMIFPHSQSLKEIQSHSDTDS